MSVLEFILFMGVMVGVMGVMIKVMTNYLSKSLAKNIGDNFRAADSIVNNHCIPEAWVTPYRKKVRVGMDQEKIEKIGRAAKKHCQSEIKKLIKLFASGRFADSPDTRNLILSRLRQAEKTWETADWRMFLDEPKPPEEETPEPEAPAAVE